MRTKNRIDRLERRIKLREYAEPQKNPDIPDAPLNIEEWKKFCIWELGESYGSDADPEMKKRWEEWAARSAALFESKMAQN
jgi:hypothetical protein